MKDAHDRLPPNQQRIRPQRWPIVGEHRSRDHDDTPWTVSISGGLQNRCYTLEELAAFEVSELVCDIHCVTRWSKFDMRFSGIRLAKLLDGEFENPNGKFLSFVARSSRNHSTSLPLTTALELQALVALRVNGGPLPPDHGGPIRMVVPGRYFYKSIKWLERIDILSHDRLGYWEEEAGYHNEADPWLEQRYVASAISKQEAALLIRKRNFTERDLLGIAAADRDLTGLLAQRALLRNADFSRAKLAHADFSHANLSNASFVGSDLRQANFAAADLDGANLSSADLRGADLRVDSMFGTSFCVFDEAGRATDEAIWNASTRVDRSKLHGLTEQQRSWLLSRIG